MGSTRSKLTWQKVDSEFHLKTFLNLMMSRENVSTRDNCFTNILVEYKWSTVNIATDEFVCLFGLFGLWNLSQTKGFLFQKEWSRWPNGVKYLHNKPWRWSLGITLYFVGFKWAIRYFGGRLGRQITLLLE